jgi:biopolymer transport protein TolQ
MDFLPQTGFLTMIANATLMVKVVMVILLFMSVTTWSIIIFKLIVFGRFKSQVRAHLRLFEAASDLVTGMKLLRENSGSPLYTIGYRAVLEIQKLEQANLSPNIKFRVAEDNVRRTLKQGVSSQLKVLSNSLAFLATCGSAAPFIGLFGTVWGIMHSFHSIGLQKSASLATVAPGISEALIATAIGLAVAIPATMAYNYFLGQLNAIQTELINFAGTFLNRVQMELPWLKREE